MSKFFRKLIWKIIKPTLRFEWGTNHFYKYRAYCNIYILGKLACHVEADDDGKGLVFCDALTGRD